MNCREFLNHHSDYLDDALDTAGRAACRAHMGVCASCARYDDVVRRALAGVHALEPVRPRRRLGVLEVRREAESRPLPRVAAVGALGVLAIAGVLVAIAWSPLLRVLSTGVNALRDDVVAEAATTAAPPAPEAAPAHAERLLTGPADPTPFRPSSFPAEPFQAAAPDLGTVPPGPYSPLPLEPPDFGRPSVVRAAAAIYSGPAK